MQTWQIWHYFMQSYKNHLCYYLGGSPDQLVKSVKQAHRAVRQVKSDFQVLRAVHSRQLQTFEHFMKYSCGQIMTHIRAANLSTGMWLYQFIYLYPMNNYVLFSEVKLFTENEEA